MSKVDERIVQMTFENHLFERNANTSIQTLEKLNNALKLEGASKSLQDVEKTVSTIDMSKLSSDIDTLTKRFSTLGVVGMTVIQNITNSLLNTATGALSKWYNGTIGQIMSGGWSRATNIDQAKFKLEGLHVLWDDIYNDIDGAVKGTAYGFDEAAQAAAQLAASGIKYGKQSDQMAKSLRAISGVAAMTNTTYSETAHIFTQIAGQGKVMTYQLRMLENRGLNTAAEIAKAMGKTEEEVRDMVTKGQLDAETFFNKMYDAYAEFAGKANETYEGSLANMKAALSRIGQPFFEPYRKGMVNVHNAWREFYVAVKEKGLIPSGIYEEASRLIANITNLKSTLISSIPTEPILYAATAVKEVLVTINNGLETLFPFLDKLLPKNKEAAESTKELGEVSEETAKSIDELAEAVIRGEYGNGQKRIDKLDVLYKTVQNRVNEMLGCSKRYEISQEEATAVTEKLGGAIGDTVKETKQYKYLADELSDVIGHATHNVEEARKAFLMHKQLDKVASFVAGITSVFNVLGRTVLSVAKGAIDPFSKLFVSVGKSALNLGDKIGKKLIKFREYVEQSGFYEKVEKASGNIFSFISDTLIDIGKGGEKAFAILENGFGKVKTLAGQAKERFDAFFEEFKKTNGYKRLADNFEKIKERVLEIKKNALDVVNNAINSFLGREIKLPEIDASGFAKNVSDKIEWILDKIEEIKAGLKNFFIKHTGEGSVIDSISDAISNFSASDAANAFLSWLVEAKEKIGNFFSSINEGKIIDLKAFGDTIKEFFKNLKDLAGNVGTDAGEAISNFVTKLKESIPGLDDVWNIFWSVLKKITAVNAIRGLNSIFISFVSISKILWNAGYVVRKAGKVVKAVSEVINSYAKANNAQSLKQVAIAVGIFAGSMALLGQLSWDQLKVAAVGIGIITVALLILLKALSKFSDKKVITTPMEAITKVLNSYQKTVKSFLTDIGRSATIAALALAVGIIGKVFAEFANIPWGDAKKALKTMGVILIELAVAMGIMTRLSGKNTSIRHALTVLALAEAIKIVAGSLSLLTEIDSSKIRQVSELLTLVTSSLAGLMIASRFMSKGAIGVIFMAASLYAMISALKKLEDMDPESLKTSVEAIVAVLGGLSLLAFTSRNIFKRGSFKTAIGNFLGIGLLLAELAFIFKQLEDINPDVVSAVGSAFVGVIKALSLAMLVAGGIGKKTKGVKGGFAGLFEDILGGLSTALKFDIMLANFGAIFAVAGWLNDHAPGITKAIANGVPTMIAFASDLGKVFGAFVEEALVNPVIESLPTLGENISGFLEIMKPYLDGTEPLDTTSLNSLLTLLWEFGKMELAAAVGRAIGLFTGESSLLEFARALYPFAQAFQAYAAYMKLVDADVVTNTSKAIETVTAYAADVPNEGGWISTLIGDNTLAQFARGLIPFATAMQAYSAYMKLVDPDVVSNTSAAVETIMAYAVEVPNEGGLISDLVGDNTLAQFAQGLIPFATAMQAYSAYMKLVDPDVVTNTSKAVDTIMKYANETPNEGGLISKFTGDNTLAQFARGLIPFATAMQAYSAYMKLVDADVVANTSKAVDTIMKYANAVPNEGGLLADIVGDNTLAQFAQGLIPFAIAMQAYAAYMKLLDSDAVENSANACQIVVDMANSIPNDLKGSVLGWIAGNNNLTDFGKNLTNFADSLITYSDKLKGVDFSKSIEATKQVSDLMRHFARINLSQEGLNQVWMNTAKITDWVGELFGNLSTELSAEGQITSLEEAGKKMLEAITAGFSSGISTAGDTDTSALASGIAQGIVQAITSDALSDAALAESGEAFTTKLLDSWKTSLSTKTNELDPSMKAILDAMLLVIDDYNDDFDEKAEGALLEVHDIIADDTGVPSAVGIVCQAAVDKANAYVGQFVGIGGDMMSGLAAGITMNSQLVVNAVSAAVSNAPTTARSLLQINSPSKVFMRIGSGIMEGMALGITDNTNLATDAVSSAASHTVTAMTNALGDNQSRIDEKMQDVFRYLESAYAYINSVISDSLDVQPTITPVVDLSQIQNGLNNANGLFANSGLPFGMNSLNYARSMWPGSYQYGAQQIQASQQAGVISAIRGIRSDLAYLGESIQNMQMVMDSGAVVGSIGGGMDRELGKIQMYKERWA